MRVAFIGDIHLSDRPPSLRTDSYAEDILAKLDFCVLEADNRECDVLVLNGDVFHVKAAGRNSHRLVQATAEVLNRTRIPKRIVPGNHDLSNDRLESLSKQPLGTLAKAENIELLIGPDPEFPIFGIPYLHDWLIELPKWMRRYTKWADQQRLEDEKFWPLMVTHAPIFPPGEDPPYEYVGGDDWAKMMQNGDCTYGHIHVPHGAYKPDEGYNVTLCNYGAISRGSLHEEALNRKPQFGIWEGTPGSFQAVDIPHRPIEAVFRLGVKEKVEDKQERAESFLEAVGTTSLERLSIEEVMQRAEEADLRPQTKVLVRRLLEEAMSQ